MADYIDREAALDIFGDVPMWNGYFEPYPWEVHCAIVGTTKLVREEIEKIPAADVAPVKHERWIEYPRAHYFKCSGCKYTVPYRKAALLGRKREYNFCPNCGARMDGDE